MSYICPEVRTTGQAAKATKQAINRKRIYPPLTGSKDDLFAAVAATVQAPPPTYGRHVVEPVRASINQAKRCDEGDARLVPMAAQRGWGIATLTLSTNDP